MKKQIKNTSISNRNLFDDPVDCCKVYDKGKLVYQQNLSYLLSDAVCQLKDMEINPNEEPGDQWNVTSGECDSESFCPIIDERIHDK